jgi:hypothetical protein
MSPDVFRFCFRADQLFFRLCRAALAQLRQASLAVTAAANRAQLQNANNNLPPTMPQSFAGFAQSLDRLAPFVSQQHFHPASAAANLHPSPNTQAAAFVYPAHGRYQPNPAPADVAAQGGYSFTDRDRDPRLRREQERAQSPVRARDRSRSRSRSRERPRSQFASNSSAEEKAREKGKRRHNSDPIFHRLKRAEEANGILTKRIERLDEKLGDAAKQIESMRRVIVLLEAEKKKSEEPSQELNIDSLVHRVLETPVKSKVVVHLSSLLGHSCSDRVVKLCSMATQLELTLDELDEIHAEVKSNKLWRSFRELYSKEKVKRSLPALSFWIQAAKQSLPKSMTQAQLLRAFDLPKDSEIIVSDLPAREDFNKDSSGRPWDWTEPRFVSTVPSDLFPCDAKSKKLDLSGSVLVFLRSPDVDVQLSRYVPFLSRLAYVDKTQTVSSFMRFRAKREGKVIIEPRVVDIRASKISVIKSAQVATGETLPKPSSVSSSSSSLSS